MTASRAYAQAAEPSNFFVAGKNKIINGDFNINQRAFTSTTTTNTYGFDRWTTAFAGDGTATYSAQTFTPGTAPVAGYESTNYARLVTASQTSAAVITRLEQRIEDVRTFAGQTATFSFWAKAASGTPKITLELAQAYGTGGTATANVYGGQVTISTAWQRYSITIAIPSVAGTTITSDSNLAIRLWVSAGSTYNARTNSMGIQNNTFDFWGVQFEAGSVATPFTTATGTLAGELAACQRYYYRVTPGDSRTWGVGAAASTTQAYIGVHFPVTMRVRPTALEQTGTASNYSIGYSTSDTACDAVPVFFNGNETFMFVTFQVPAVLTANWAVRGRSNAAGAYLAWSAEL